MMKVFFSFVLVFTSIFAAKPKEGEKLSKIQSFIYNAAAAPGSLDPAKMEGSQEVLFARNIFETLVISDDNDKLIPGVAYRWESSKDHKTWTFYLRKDAKWSNGDPVTAHDFVYAWRRVIDPKTASPSASYILQMKLKNSQDILEGKKEPKELGIVAKDDYTIVLNLEESVPFADLFAESYSLSPVPRKIVEKFGESWVDIKNIVGNGAFKLDYFMLNEEAKLSKNPYYWDAKNVILEKLTFLQIPSEGVAFTRYRSGALDVSTYPLELFDRVKREYSNELLEVPTLCTYYYEFNYAKPIFQDLRVRKALNMSIDREVLVEKLLKQGRLPAYNFTPPYVNIASFIKQPEWASWDGKKRYEEAKKLLLEAGYSKAKPLQFTLRYNTSEGHKKLAIAVTSMWKKNLDGLVKIKLQNQEWRTFLSEKRLGTHELGRGGWCSGYNEPSGFLYILLSNASNNTGKYSNPDFDAALQAAYQANTDEQRAAQYALAEKILYDDSALIPVYFYTASELVKPYVRGYKPKPSNAYYFKNVYILEH